MDTQWYLFQQAYHVSYFFFLIYQVSVIIIISVMDSLFLAMQICYHLRAFLRNVFAHFLEMILAHF